MIIAYLIINALIAAIFSGILIAIIGRPTAKSKGLGFLFYFVLLFLAMWAGALWITPFGPVIYGAAILPILMVAVLISLLIVVSAMTPFERDTLRTPTTPGERKAVMVAFGVFFWIVVVVLIGMILGGYMFVV